MEEGEEQAERSKAEAKRATLRSGPDRHDGSPRFDFKGGAEAKYVIQGVNNFNLYDDRADRPEAKRARQDLEPGSGKREGSSVSGLTIGGNAQVEHMNVYGPIGVATGGSSVQQHTGSGAIPKSREDRPDRIQLTGSVCYFPKKRISKRVFHGEQTTPDGKSRPIAVKTGFWDKNILRESKILLSLGAHQNVVTFIDSGTYNHGETMFLAMELCYEQNLRQHTEARMKSGQPFDNKLAIKHAKQIVAGLAYIHGNEIIHRDLKPDNILFSLKRTDLKISDFDLSKEVETRSTSSSFSGQAGTDGYRAPEVILYRRFSKKTDIFSLGLVLHYIWSYGKHPYGPDPTTWSLHISRNLNPNFSGLIVVSKFEAINLLGGMLHFEPEKRPSIQQVEDDRVFGGMESAHFYREYGFQSVNISTGSATAFNESAGGVLTADGSGVSFRLSPGLGTSNTLDIRAQKNEIPDIGEERMQPAKPDNEKKDFSSAV